jgi:hypothetical protein
LGEALRSPNPKQTQQVDILDDKKKVLKTNKENAETDIFRPMGFRGIVFKDFTSKDTDESYKEFVFKTTKEIVKLPDPFESNEQINWLSFESRDANFLAETQEVLRAYREQQHGPSPYLKDNYGMETR